MAETQGGRVDPWVGYWLTTLCVCVVAMILVGGATRLTDSGLSITEWRLDKGLTPPLSEARWDEEFALYQQTTEYRQQNRGMSLGEFQRIYWWEWGHRFLGKVTGLAFILPFIAFCISGRLRGRFWPVLALGLAIGVQGAVGWWMVKSGLAGRLDVSPIRLATHLALAFLILGYALWLTLGAFSWPRKASTTGVSRRIAFGFLALLFVQIVFGALMAGADGGPAYADWPTIGGHWIPNGYAALDPFWRNVFENHATQHLHHRTLGYVVAVAALALAWPGARKATGSARTAMLALGGVALAQAALGIAVVLTATPLSLSLVHQSGAVVLWLCGVTVLWYSYTGNKIPAY